MAENKVNIPSDKRILLFDGVCNLCNTMVQFVLKRDKKGKFLFGSLQGQAGQQILRELDMPDSSFNTFILLENGQPYFKSGAILRVLRQLDGGWSLAYAFMIIPRFIRNAVYDLISRNRYRWFGKKDSCMIPEPKWESRFLP